MGIWVVLLALIASCGRIAFDPTDPGTDATAGPSPIEHVETGVAIIPM